ncbi:MAG TPA: 3'(2'),5'-bisphosphate nucleotidase CysQ [Thermodesulfovibrionales bacterium]|nr:3'(2'),5'-bisphosphate nucleotidase CysQ [Thermodesulfovibrionales bacterium]
MQGLRVERFHTLIPGLLRISRDAGAAILEVYDSDFAIEHKEDKSPLTLADRRSHEVIVNGLSGLDDMEIPILSEEGKNIPFEDRRAWEIFWLVDPLDGTKEFIRRNGEFTVNIALIQKGRPVLGVIYIPAQDIFYFGAEGLGSFKLEDGDTLSSGPLEKILGPAIRLPLDPHSSVASQAVRFAVIASRSHLSPETVLFINDLRAKHGELNFISAGSSLKFCLIAEGIANVYPRFAPTMEWDTAAGQAIVENAGGRVLRADSRQPVTYNKEDLHNPWFVAERSP